MFLKNKFVLVSCTLIIIGLVISAGTAQTSKQPGDYVGLQQNLQKKLMGSKARLSTPTAIEKG